MYIYLLILSTVFSLELKNSENVMFINSIMPNNISKDDSLKDIAKKAYKKNFSNNNSKTTSSSIINYELNNDFNFKLKSGFMFHDFKLMLNSNLVKAQISYLTYENKMNMKLYKDLNKNLSLSLSEEKCFKSDLDLILFNFSYKF